MAKQDNNVLLPVYLVHGEDELKRDAVVKKLRSRLDQCGDMAFNCDEIDAETVESGVVVTSCNTIPFASEYRLVLVRNAEKLQKSEAEALVDYLKSPNPSTILCLVAEKIAKNTRLYKAVASVGANAIIECAAIKKNDLPKTVRAMAVAHGVTFTDGAARALVDLVGENTVRLDSEIRKIALASQSGITVSEENVRGLIVRTSEVKPWEFVNSFAARDVNACLTQLRRMESVSVHALLPMCVNRLRELACAKSIARRGSANTATLASALASGGGRKMADWQLKNHFAWARGFKASELRIAIIEARDAERLMKSGSDPNQVFLEWMLAVITK